MRKRIIAAVLSCLLLIPAGFAINAYANPGNRTDDFIFSDPVVNTYTGHLEGTQLIRNLRFTDMPNDPAAQDAIVRSGVHNFIKGDAPQFRPGARMTIQEAIAFALRAGGYENEARLAGLAAPETLPINATARDTIYHGFLVLARNMDLISEAQFLEVFNPPPTVVAPDGVRPFIRTEPATRQEFAHWLSMSITSRNAGAFNTPGPTPGTQHQALFGFVDWNSVAPEFLQGVENMARSGVMTGNNNRFRPQEYITRMEAAWAGRALDSIFHGIAALERFHGTVGAIVDGQAITAHQGMLQRDILIRRDDGHVDLLVFDVVVGGSPQEGARDAVVLKNGMVGGLGLLAVGDNIEYVVHPGSGTVLYVVVGGDLVRRQAMGRLQRFDFDAGTVTFSDEDGRVHTFALAQGLMRTTPAGVQEVRLRTVWQSLPDFPFGSLFTINLTNNLITEMEFAGQFIIAPETWGVVIANNPMLGYLVIRDAQGHERTFNYNVGELQVQKREHYDMRDTIGGIHALFPNMRFNPLETSMSAIEPGNVVSFRTDPADPTMITSIHASTFYTTRYGLIREFRTDGNMHSFLMEFDNGRTAWFDMPDGVLIRRDARPVNAAQVQAGDWARILINQATLGAGHIMESVKAMDLEGDARHITSIVRGQLNNINLAQNQLVIRNTQRMAQAGWVDYRNLSQYSITAHGQHQIEYFHNGQPVSLGFVNQNLRHSDAEVYIAMETSHGGERVRMVSFRTGRDELLNPDTVVGVDGAGGFNILSNEGTISTDAGTIVRRNGRLVDGRHIHPWDHAVVALNGENRAAVVDISAAPAYAGLQIVRGRLQSVDQGRNFRVQSMALFDGVQWHFTPIEREFTIDNQTMFMVDDEAPMNINQFIDFNAIAPDLTADSRIDQVFNIVVDGSRAAWVTDAPYSTQAMRGVIYSVDGDTIFLRDVHVRDTLSGRWSVISNISATATATVHSNSIIVDRNQVINANALQIGQQVRIMTRAADFPTVAQGMEVDGFIVLVER